jgi:HSP20 family protein
MPERQKSTKERSWAGNPSERNETAKGSEVPITGERKQQDTGRTAQRANAIGRTRGRDVASPFGLMHQLSDEMSRFFQNFGFDRDLTSAAFNRDLLSPRVDVLRRGDNVVIRADLPGLSKDDITIDVRDNVLTIRAEQREEKREEGEGYYWQERSAGRFSRSIPLPDGADADQASARFENGVLEVAVPAPEQQPDRGRRIDIR